MDGGGFGGEALGGGGGGVAGYGEDGERGLGRGGGVEVEEGVDYGAALLACCAGDEEGFGHFGGGLGGWEGWLERRENEVNGLEEKGRWFTCDNDGFLEFGSLSVAVFAVLTVR